MKKLINIILSFLLIGILLICVSCQQVKETQMDESEILAILEGLIPKGAEAVNLMFNVNVSDNDPEIIETNDSFYYPIKIAGYETTQDVKDVIREVFTEERSNIIFDEIFEPLIDSQNRVYGARLSDIEGRLYVNVGFGNYGGDVVWVFKNMTILKQSENEILVEMPMYYISNFGDIRGGVYIRQMELKIENGKWRINSALRLGEKGLVAPSWFK